MRTSDFSWGLVTFHGYSSPRPVKSWLNCELWLAYIAVADPKGVASVVFIDIVISDHIPV